MIMNFFKDAQKTKICSLQSEAGKKLTLIHKNFTSGSKRWE